MVAFAAATILASAVAGGAVDDGHGFAFNRNPVPSLYGCRLQSFPSVQGGSHFGLGFFMASPSPSADRRITAHGSTPISLSRWLSTSPVFASSSSLHLRRVPLHTQSMNTNRARGPMMAVVSGTPMTAR